MVRRMLMGCMGSLVGRATARDALGSIPAGSALEVWPWTSDLKSLVDY